MSSQFNLIPKCKDCYKSHAKKQLDECKKDLKGYRHKCIYGSRFKGSCQSCLFDKGIHSVEHIFRNNEFCTHCLKNECLFTLNVYQAVE